MKSEGPYILRPELLPLTANAVAHIGESRNGNGDLNEAGIRGELAVQADRLNEYGEIDADAVVAALRGNNGNGRSTDGNDAISRLFRDLSRTTSNSVLADSDEVSEDDDFDPEAALAAMLEDGDSATFEVEEGAAPDHLGVLSGEPKTGDLVVISGSTAAKLAESESAVTAEEHKPSLRFLKRSQLATEPSFGFSDLSYFFGDIPKHVAAGLALAEFLRSEHKDLDDVEPIIEMAAKLHPYTELKFKTSDLPKNFELLSSYLDKGSEQDRLTAVRSLFRTIGYDFTGLESADDNDFPIKKDAEALLGSIDRYISGGEHVTSDDMVAIANIVNGPRGVQGPDLGAARIAEITDGNIRQDATLLRNLIYNSDQSITEIVATRFLPGQLGLNSAKDLTEQDRAALVQFVESERELPVAELDTLTNRVFGALTKNNEAHVIRLLRQFSASMNREPESEMQRFKERFGLEGLTASNASSAEQPEESAALQAMRDFVNTSTGEATAETVAEFARPLFEELKPTAATQLSRIDPNKDPYDNFVAEILKLDGLAQTGSYKGDTVESRVKAVGDTFACEIQSCPELERLFVGEANDADLQTVASAIIKATSQERREGVRVRLARLNKSEDIVTTIVARFLGIADTSDVEEIEVDLNNATFPNSKYSWRELDAESLRVRPDAISEVTTQRLAFNMLARDACEGLQVQNLPPRLFRLLLQAASTGEVSDETLSLIRQHYQSFLESYRFELRSVDDSTDTESAVNGTTKASVNRMINFSPIPEQDQKEAEEAQLERELRMIADVLCSILRQKQNDGSFKALRKIVTAGETRQKIYGSLAGVVVGLAAIGVDYSMTQNQIEQSRVEITLPSPVVNQRGAMTAAIDLASYFQRNQETNELTANPRSAQEMGVITGSPEHQVISALQTHFRPDMLESNFGDRATVIHLPTRGPDPFLSPSDLRSLIETANGDSGTSLSSNLINELLSGSEAEAILAAAREVGPERQISDPIETNYGPVIITWDSTRANAPQSLADYLSMSEINSFSPGERQLYRESDRNQQRYLLQTLFQNAVPEGQSIPSDAHVLFVPLTRGEDRDIQNEGTDNERDPLAENIVGLLSQVPGFSELGETERAEEARTIAAKVRRVRSNYYRNSNLKQGRRTPRPPAAFTAVQTRFGPLILVNQQLFDSWYERGIFAAQDDGVVEIDDFGNESYSSRGKNRLVALAGAAQIPNMLKVSKDPALNDRSDILTKDDYQKAQKAVFLKAKVQAVTDALSAFEIPVDPVIASQN